MIILQCANNWGNDLFLLITPDKKGRESYFSLFIYKQLVLYEIKSGCLSTHQHDNVGDASADEAHATLPPFTAL